MMLAGFLGRRHRGGQSMAQQMRMRINPDALGEGPKGLGGVLGTDRGVAFGAQDEVQLDRPWGLAWLGQRQPNGPSMTAQRLRDRLLLRLVVAQRGDRERRQAQDRVAGGRFQRADDQQLAALAVRAWLAGDQLPVDVGQCLAEPDGGGVEAEVLPFQAAQLAGSRAGRRGQDHEGAQPRPEVVLGGGEQQVDLLAGQQGRLIDGEGGWFGVVGGVGGQAVPFHPVAECLVQAAVHLEDGAGVQAPRLTVLAATSCQLLVQLLDMEGPKRADRPLAKGGADAVFQQLAVAADGAQPDRAGVVEVGKPAVQ